MEPWGCSGVSLFTGLLARFLDQADTRMSLDASRLIAVAAQARSALSICLFEGFFPMSDIHGVDPWVGGGFHLHFRLEALDRAALEPDGLGGRGCVGDEQRSCYQAERLGARASVPNVCSLCGLWPHPRASR